MDNILSPDKMLKQGLLLLGFSRADQNKKNPKMRNAIFQCMFGSSPTVCCAIWEDLQTTEIPEARINCDADKSATIPSFLMANHFLYRYPTVMEQSVIFKVSVPVLREQNHYFVEKFAALKGQKVSFYFNFFKLFLLETYQTCSFNRLSGPKSG